MFLVPLVVFLGVKFGIRKSCLCKRNDKYEVCYKGPVLQAYFRLVNFDILGKLKNTTPNFYYVCLRKSNIFL